MRYEYTKSVGENSHGSNKIICEICGSFYFYKIDTSCLLSFGEVSCTMVEVPCRRMICCRIQADSLSIFSGGTKQRGAGKQDRGGSKMKRNVSLAEISDGRLYRSNDMVKADCHGCRGCFKCCTGMGNSVILDPWDVYRLQQGIGKGLPQLLSEGAAELNVVDGVILPNLKMAGRAERCVFLNKEGRCSIHNVRPGICRLFPLGRYYEDNDFRYFLQIRECPAPNRSKVKVAKWIDTPDQNRNHDFLCRWHGLLNRMEEIVAGQEDSEQAKQLNLAMLQIFYMEIYETEADFYEQFEKRAVGFETMGGMG